MDNFVDLKRAFVADRERYSRLIERLKSGQMKTGELNQQSGQKTDTTGETIKYMTSIVEQLDALLAEK